MRRSWVCSALLDAIIAQDIYELRAIKNLGSDVQSLVHGKIAGVDTKPRGPTSYSLVLIADVVVGYLLSPLKTASQTQNEVVDRGSNTSSIATS